MKQRISTRVILAALAIVSAPAITFAQKDKDKNKEKDEKVQTIVITRTGDGEEKMTIEVDGQKVKVNGKDVKDLKDVNVRVNTVNSMAFSNGQAARTWNLNRSGNQFSFFNEDENRAMLGVNTDDDVKGAKITSIVLGSAAEKAGLKKGDVIIKMGDDKIENAEDVSEAMQDHKPGDKVAVAYLRDGKEQKVNAELGKWKGFRMTADMGLGDAMSNNDTELWRSVSPPRIVNGSSTFIFSGRPRLGLSIEETDDSKGVKVLDVEEESNAAKAGLKKDDIILSIDDKELKSTDDVMRIIRADKDKYNFTFKVQRAGKTENIEVKFPKKLKKADL